MSVEVDEFAIVRTEHGQVRGRKVISELDVPYWRFLGIPYAKSPVGERRFQKAEKLPAWEGVRDVLDEPPPCAGRNNYIKQYVGTDDCLYMNIYTRNLTPPRKSQPVIVYIHGGGFYSGSSTLNTYSPDYFLTHDVILVIFNYRLGPLGFLSLADKSLNVPGNAGLKDQQIVLEFVRDNIHNFGGDPNNVTLMGHSSGASCVAFHCVAESSRGLFHRAVIMAGHTFWYDCDINWSKRLAVKLGFEGNLENEEEILRFLEKADVLEMAQSGMSLITDDDRKDSDLFFAFAPSIEPYVSDSTFISSSSINDLISNAWSRDIDILIGGVANEGRVQSSSVKDKKLVLLDEIPKELKIHQNKEKSEEICEIFKPLFKEVYLTADADEDFGWENFFGDRFIWSGLCRFIKNRKSARGKGKTFLYKFGVDSPTQNHYRNRYFGAGSKGVCHADELSYLWKNNQGPVPPKDSMEFNAVMNFVSIFTNFADSGHPSIASWNPVQDEPYSALIITKDGSKFEKLVESERIQRFWSKLYEAAGVKF